MKEASLFDCGCGWVLSGAYVAGPIPRWNCSEVGQDYEQGLFATTKVLSKYLLDLCNGPWIKHG